MAIESWVKGNTPDIRHRALRDAVQRADTAEDQALFDSMYLGSASLRLMKGIAETPDIKRVMAALVADAEMGIRDKTSQLLAEADPSSERAKQYHFEARVLAQMINYLNDYVRAAMEAGKSINNADLAPEIQDG